MRTDTADRGTGGLARYTEERALLPRLGFFINNESRLPFDCDGMAPRTNPLFLPQIGRRQCSPCDALISPRRVTRT